jgi:hypothetical protein
MVREMPPIKRLENMSVELSTGGWLCPGDILGQSSYKLPEHLKHLKGWIVVGQHLANDVRLIEPEHLAPKGKVTYVAAMRHIATLQEQGHRTAQLWENSHRGDITDALELSREFNERAGLKLGKNDYYWGADRGTHTYKSGPAKGHSREGRYIFNATPHMDPKRQRLAFDSDSCARVRAVQDIPITDFDPNNDEVVFRRIREAAARDGANFENQHS